MGHPSKGPFGRDLWNMGEFAAHRVALLVVDHNLQNLFFLVQGNCSGIWNARF